MVYQVRIIFDIYHIETKLIGTCAFTQNCLIKRSKICYSCFGNVRCRSHSNQYIIRFNFNLPLFVCVCLCVQYETYWALTHNIQYPLYLTCSLVVDLNFAFKLMCLSFLRMYGVCCANWCIQDYRMMLMLFILMRATPLKNHSSRIIACW